MCGKYIGIGEFCGEVCGGICGGVCGGFRGGFAGGGDDDVDSIPQKKIDRATKKTIPVNTASMIFIPSFLPFAMIYYR